MEKMREITLIRVATSEKGTFGVLIDQEENMPFALTLELPWEDNQVNISCIPPGIYLCDTVNSPRFGYTFQVSHVEGRSHILFHRGNYKKDTKGCILIGEQFEDDIILASRAGYREFMFRLKGCLNFQLTIKECYQQEE
jgi:hypothetical protein